MTCANTISGATSQIPDLQGSLDFLEARPNPSPTPPKPPAICQSADDYDTETTELETACRILGDSCTYQLQQELKTRRQILERIRGKAE